MLKRVLGGIVVVIAGVVPLALPSIAGAATSPEPVTPYSGFNALLTRAPYVTDLTQTSAYINWATTSTSPGGPNVFGSVQVVPMNGSSCPVSTSWTPSAITAPSTLPGPVNALNATGTMTGSQFTVNGAGTTASEYQNSVPVGGLAPGTTYCYTIYSTHSAGAADLLPASKPYQTFTTLMPPNTSSTKPVTFDVIDDTGENYSFTSATASTDVPWPGLVNPDQASLYHQIGTSGANFLLSVGDIAYNGSSQSTFGDLEQTGTQPEVSDIFGPNYLPQANGIPIFAGSGDHGQNVTTLKVLPTPNTAAASGGTYAFDSYSGTDGISGDAPDDWYAFSTGNVRIYVLDGTWAEASKLGTATGTLCGPAGGTQATECLPYQADADVHWQQSSEEYQWLQRDLAAHPGGVKMAMFHFPLRSVNASQPSDPYIQNSPSNPNASTSLEALLARYGVSIAFNGHAHTYQRIIPNNYQQNGQLISYVTGGGGGVLEPVVGGSCNTMVTQASVYALGWSPSSGSPSACGAGVPEPSSAADVFSFLKVTVNGNSVTVAPTNAAGNTFDVQTYNLSAQAGTVGPGSSPPSQAGSGSSSCMTHLPSGSVVGSAATKSGSGYYEVDTAGDVAAFGNATCYGSMTGTPLTQPIVGMATDPSGGGYWLVARDGGIFSFGDAQFYGSTGAMHLNQPVVGMSSDASGHGYWLVASDGGIFSFGDAVFHGGTGGIHINKPVVGMTTTSNGAGYWLVASDGGIFSFGDAVFHGSTGNIVLNRPIVGMATDASGQGYWLMASDGGVFSFGDAPFLGSAA